MNKDSGGAAILAVVAICSSMAVSFLFAKASIEVPALTVWFSSFSAVFGIVAFFFIIGACFRIFERIWD